MSDKHREEKHECRCEEVREEELYPKLAEIIAENRNKPENLIMVLHKAQNLFGYLPKRVQQEVAEGLGLSLSQVHGVISFYSFFSTSPKGKNSVKVCLGTACYVRGGQQALAKVKQELNIVNSYVLFIYLVLLLFQDIFGKKWIPIKLLLLDLVVLQCIN